jgi:hypothetical protein
MWKFIVCAGLVALTLPALSEERRAYCMPTSDGRHQVERVGSCPTGYISRRDCCEARRIDTPIAFPRLDGTPCPRGYRGVARYCVAIGG